MATRAGCASSALRAPIAAITYSGIAVLLPFLTDLQERRARANEGVSATKVLSDLGSASLISPAVAAWSPAVVGAMLGALVLLYQEDG